jgi:hypothetical protein
VFLSFSDAVLGEPVLADALSDALSDAPYLGTLDLTAPAEAVGRLFAV